MARIVTEVKIGSTWSAGELYIGREAVSGFLGARSISVRYAVSSSRVVTLHLATPFDRVQAKGIKFREQVLGVVRLADRFLDPEQR